MSNTASLVSLFYVMCSSMNVKKQSKSTSIQAARKISTIRLLTIPGKILLPYLTVPNLFRIPCPNPDGNSPFRA